MSKWIMQCKKADFKEIGDAFQIDPVIARLIRNRDIVTKEEVEKYLYGKRGNV